MIQGMHHVAVRCADMAQYNAALKLYVETFGFKILRQWGFDTDLGCMIDVGNTIIELFSSRQNSNFEGPVAHIAFKTDSVDECLNAVKKLGYTEAVPAKNVTIDAGAPYKIRCAFIIGPAHELIEFFEEL